MKLFHRGSSPLSDVQKPAPATAEVTAGESSAEAAAPSAIVHEKFPAISMSADLQGMLDQPLDPRVDRILQKINDSKIAEARSIKEARIVRFPRRDKQDRLSDPDVTAPLTDRL